MFQAEFGGWAMSGQFQYIKLYGSASLSARDTQGGAATELCGSCVEQLSNHSSAPFLVLNTDAAELGVAAGDVLRVGSDCDVTVRYRNRRFERATVVRGARHNSHSERATGLRCRP